MGSGDRITFQSTDAFGFGINVCRFPFAVTLNLHFLLWHLSVGLGKGYDEHAA